jgi:hypothetical protein
MERELSSIAAIAVNGYIFTHFNFSWVNVALSIMRTFSQTIYRRTLSQTSDNRELTKFGTAFRITGIAIQRKSKKFLSLRR